MLSRKAVLPGRVSEVPDVVHDVLRSPGQPLDTASRTFFEPRFDYDFSQVRVHRDAQALQSARAVNAVAYTIGSHVILGSSKYSPNTRSGQRLLAHELAHVVQQRENHGRIDRQFAIGEPGTQYERNADLIADNIISGNRSSFPGILNSPVQLQREEPADAGVTQSPDAGVTPADAGAAPKPPAKCSLPAPENCKTYHEWLDTFPASVSSADLPINTSLPTDLQKLIQGKLGHSGNLPDCADVALLLRHHYLKARGQSFSFKVGRTVDTAETFTLGQPTTDKEIKACMVGTGTESFQETRKDFALVNFYKAKGKNIVNLKSLIAAGLAAGDMFVWKRRPEIKGNFQGHAQTIQSIVPPKADPKDATKFISDGAVVVVQGNMEAGKGMGELQQRYYMFTELTGKPEGDADITLEPRHKEEFFFGAGPWKG